MAGIYIHIPFCKKACSYCNFHFSTSLNLKDAMLNALVKEIKLRAIDWNKDPIKTIYFGGGTPSLLSRIDLELIFETLTQNFNLSELEEVTLEANPDDLTVEKVLEFKDSPIDRLSIGIQSFKESDLLLMNRAHNVTEAHKCIEIVKNAGFEKMTIDLIYGTPGLSNQDWMDNLQIAADYDIPHLSCYALTVEPKTALQFQVKKGILPAPDDHQMAEQFMILMDFAQQNFYDHYEISNFAQKGHYALHNTAYWNGAPYLGLGPSAHSFDKKNRYWNVSNNAKYIKSLEQNILPLEFEELSIKDHYNELVLTHLRTAKGVERTSLSKFPEYFLIHFNKEVQKWIGSDHLFEDNDAYKLSREGKLMADHIASDLFFLD